MKRTRLFASIVYYFAFIVGVIQFITWVDPTWMDSSLSKP